MCAHALEAHSHVGCNQSKGAFNSIHRSHRPHNTTPARRRDTRTVDLLRPPRNARTSHLNSLSSLRSNHHHRPTGFDKHAGRRRPQFLTLPTRSDGRRSTERARDVDGDGCGVEPMSARRGSGNCSTNQVKPDEHPPPYMNASTSCSPHLLCTPDSSGQRLHLTHTDMGTLPPFTQETHCGSDCLHT